MALLDANEKLDWLKKIPREEIEKHLTRDIKMIYEVCGLDILVLLWQNFASISFYLSTAPLNELKKIYARKFYNGTNTKQLALELQVSEQFIYAAQKDKDGSSPDDPRLFPEL